MPDTPIQMPKPREFSNLDQQLLEVYFQLARESYTAALASDCLLTNTGNFLMHLINMVAALSERCVCDDFLEKFTDVQKRSKDKKESGSHYLDEKLKLLRYQANPRKAASYSTLITRSSIPQRMNEALETIETEWWNFPAPPADGKAYINMKALTTLAKVYEANNPSTSDLHIESSSDISSVNGSDRTSTSGDLPVSTIETMEEPSTRSTTLLRNLNNGAVSTIAQSNASPKQDSVETIRDLPQTKKRKRGTGEYTCPHGYQCQKGGVVDGTLKVFKRNCDYENHLAKHDKPFKCSISGCLNPGFARKDQVRRHEETVHSKSEEITIKLVSPSSVENDRPQ